MTALVGVGVLVLVEVIVIVDVFGEEGPHDGNLDWDRNRNTVRQRLVEARTDEAPGQPAEMSSITSNWSEELPSVWREDRTHHWTSSTQAQASFLCLFSEFLFRLGRDLSRSVL